MLSFASLYDLCWLLVHSLFAVSFTLDRHLLCSQQWEKIRSILTAVERSDGFYARKFQAAKVASSGLAGLADFVQQVPFTYKEELLADRLAHPPFGTHLTQPLADYTRFCQTSGTSSGQPVAWLDTCESWAAMLACWQKVYDAAGLKKGEDRIFFAFSFGPFLGFWTAYEAASKDYLSLPSGGLSSQARLEMMARYGATVLCCTPTYALRLGELLGSASGVDHSSLRIEKIIVAGEPGGSIAEVRARIEKLWSARVYDHHGMTEVGPVSYEETNLPGQLAIIEEAYFAEVIDPSTGAEVADGEEGELVLTTLDRTAGPLLRYRTGDWVRKKICNGRLVLDGGVLSRVDDMVVVRGVNVYPSAVEAIVRQFEDVIEFMVEQRKVDAMDEIELLIEISSEASANLIRRLETKLRDTFSMRIPVRLADTNSLPRFEFKAKRWRRV